MYHLMGMCLANHCSLLPPSGMLWLYVFWTNSKILASFWNALVIRIQIVFLSYHSCNELGLLSMGTWRIFEESCVISIYRYLWPGIFGGNSFHIQIVSGSYFTHCLRQPNIVSVCILRVCRDWKVGHWPRFWIAVDSVIAWDFNHSNLDKLHVPLAAYERIV